MSTPLPERRMPPGIALRDSSPSSATHLRRKACAYPDESIVDSGALPHETMSSQTSRHIVNILVPDAQCPLGGIETINLRMLPELAGLGHRVVWAVPEHRLPSLQSKQSQVPGFHITLIEWPRKSCWRWIAALLRRLAIRAGPRTGNKILRRLRQAIHEKRLRHLVRKHGSQQVFYTWTLGERVPTLNVPVSALMRMT